VSTNRESAFFHEVDGCGMRCESPEFTTDEYAYYHTFLFWIAFFGLVVFAIVIGTHLICGWSDAVKSPLFYMSVCEAFIRFLLLVQFMANKESLVCAADGTRYTGGDGSYHPLCNTTAIFLFLFFAALCIEFVLFSYTFSVHVRITNPGNSEKVLAKKQPYFCMAALVIPVCLAIIIFALDFVEGDSLTGVCFVGGKNQPTARVIFVVVPICLTLCVSAYFSFRFECIMRHFVHLKCLIFRRPL
jgi:smoothened protein